MRKVWFLSAAAIVVLAIVGSAAATSHAAPHTLYAKAFSLRGIPRTPAARAAHSTINVAQEQGIDGFNLLDGNTTQLWAVIVGGTPAIRGNFIVDNNGNYHYDLATKVVATSSSLTISIRPTAKWYWQGHPSWNVSSDDYVYTYQQIMNPSNDSASTAGYSNIYKYKVVSPTKVIFYWHKPFADYKDLFGFILPKKAFSGISGGFNAAWTDCICGSDGKPVSDGPYYLNSFSVGTGAQLKANPVWYGTAPSIGTVNWILYTDQGSEEQAYNAHEVDAMYPGAATTLKQYIGQAGTVYSSINSFGQEHVDINQGKSLDGAYTPNPLLKNSWFRQAIMLGINRQAIINTVFSGIAKGITPLDNPVFFKVGSQTKWAVKQYAYMHQFNYDPKKAIKLLKAHCTGGPAVPGAGGFWTCGGKSTDIGYFTTTRQARQTTGAIVQAELKAIGINVTTHFQSAKTFFGKTTVNQDYDLGEYAWSGGVDPSGFDAIYQCVNTKLNLGGQNWKGYCSPASDKAVTNGDKFLPAGSPVRYGFYETEARLCGTSVCVIPYYGPPSILIYRSAFNLSNANNPTSTGPTWNIQNWK